MQAFVHLLLKNLHIKPGRRSQAGHGQGTHLDLGPMTSYASSQGHHLPPPQGLRLPSMQALSASEDAMTVEDGAGPGIQYGREGHWGVSRGSNMREHQF